MCSPSYPETHLEITTDPMRIVEYNNPTICRGTLVSNLIDKLLCNLIIANSML